MIDTTKISLAFSCEDCSKTCKKQQGFTYVSVYAKDKIKCGA
jgi:hypothetical protein